MLPQDAAPAEASKTGGALERAHTRVDPLVRPEIALSTKGLVACGASVRPQSSAVCDSVSRWRSQATRARRDSLHVHVDL